MKIVNLNRSMLCQGEPSLRTGIDTPDEGQKHMFWRAGLVVNKSDARKVENDKKATVRSGDQLSDRDGRSQGKQDFPAKREVRIRHADNRHDDQRSTCQEEQAKREN